MVRKWNLIREILEACEQDRLEQFILVSDAENSDSSFLPWELAELRAQLYLGEKEKKRKLILLHLRLCRDAGLISGLNVYGLNLLDSSNVNLTEKGRDFLAMLREL